MLMGLPTEPTKIDTVITLAWADDVPFDAIEAQTGLSEDEVIRLMRRELKPSSFRLWRERVSGRSSKHRALGPSKS
jgi:uncharacterized protein (TIGR03643 family)